MPEPGSKEEYRAQQSELMRAKTRLILAQTELVKAKTEKIRLQNLEYGSLPGKQESSAALEEKIARLRSKTLAVAKRYGLAPDDLDDEDGGELESF